MRSGDLAFERGDGYVERARLARRAQGPHGDFAIGNSFTSLQSTAQQDCETVGVLEKVAKRTAAGFFQAERKEVLRSHIGVNGAQLCVEHDDARGQRVQQIRWIEVRDGRGKSVLNSHGTP